MYVYDFGLREGTRGENGNEQVHHTFRVFGLEAGARREIVNLFGYGESRDEFLGVGEAQSKKVSLIVALNNIKVKFYIQLTFLKLKIYFYCFQKLNNNLLQLVTISNFIVRVHLFKIIARSGAMVLTRPLKF